jgi:hypothetical protein
MKAGKAHVHEKGQALILIALAVAGLLALTALAVDGSHLYAQRRQAQNAADTAAFAAAVALIDGNAATVYTDKGLERAADNDYTDSLNDAAVNSGQPVDVIVNHPPDSTAPPQYQNSLYVQVKIDAQIGTFFARIVGVDTLPIHVQAVTEADPGGPDPIGGENGLVALGDVCNAIRTEGNGLTRLVGGGVFSNSSKNGSPGNCWSFRAQGTGTGTQIQLPGATVVGCPHGIDPTDITSSKIWFTGGGTEIPCAQPIPWPPPPPDLDLECADQPVGTQSGTTITPGRWSNALGNLGGSGAFPPAGTNTLEAGVYCIDGNFILNSTDNVSSTGGVTFILETGALNWNAGATINFSPSTTGKLAGLLVYRPLNDPMCGTPPCQTLSFNGGIGSNWSGTIYAPDSECDVRGTQSTFNPTAQAICYIIEIGGNSIWQLNYDGATNWDFPWPPVTELNR